MSPPLPILKVGRRTIHFTDHAWDRYWQRFTLHGGHTTQDMKRDLEGARWNRSRPDWATHLSLWHRARADGYLELDEDRCFVVNRNYGTTGHLIAVTYIDRKEVLPRPTRRARAERSQSRSAPPKAA